MKKIIIITGASGTGKTSVSHYLQTKYQIPPIITHTTRIPRDNEIDSRDYYFETPASFEHNDYLERVSYDGKSYGSSMQGLTRAWEKSDVVSIVLETNGAKTYMKNFPEQAVILFLTLPPATLKQRLEDRGDDPKIIHQRVQSKEFTRDLTIPAALKDRVITIVNDNWQQTTAQLDRLIATL